MRSTRLRRALFHLSILLIGLWLPAIADATVEQSLKIRWSGERPRPAKAGQEFLGRIEIVAPANGSVQGLDVVGNGWTLLGMDAPRTFAMARGQRRVLTFRVMPQDPAQPLTVRCSYNGAMVERTLRLDPASLQRARPARFLNGSGPRSSGTGTRLSPESGARTSAMQIHFTGSVRYVRADGLHVGADNIALKIWDDDSPDPFDELIWQGSTDTLGNFNVNVSWDDCDFTGCDDPDIYLEVIADGPDVEVMADDLLETTYAWETPVLDDFNGTEVDFGNIYPGEGEDAAIHVYNSMVRAHRYSAKYGLAPGPIGVFWPDNDSQTNYDHDAEEIHVETEHEWDELVHSHEFGHHVMNVFGVLQTPNYDNGFCDEDSPGHCVWCPENATDAWQEGFANWFGQAVAEDYPVTYNLAPWAAGSQPNGDLNEGLYGAELVGACKDGNFYPGPITEGYVMAVLRDMSDPYAPNSDDHDGDGTLDCDTDAMDGGPGEILAILKDNDPTSITQFLTAFRSRYGDYYDQDLWSSVRNVDLAFSFPVPVPKVVTPPPSCRIARLGDRVTISARGNGHLLKYQWRLNGTNLMNDMTTNGVNDTTLVLSPVDVWMEGTFDCVIKTCDGTQQVTTTPTRLTVFPGTPTARPYLTWGENGWAQCGNGTKVYELPPGSYTGLTNVVEADGGRLFSVALRADGTVYTWGHTDNGEIGNGGGWNNLVPSPTQINLANVIHIAAGHNFSLALLRDGSVRGWGVNSGGQQGDSTWMDHYVPAPTKYSGCIIAIAAGQSHSLALRADGTVLASGYNDLGSLGIGTIGGYVNMPTPVVGLSNVVAIAASGYESYALKADGTVWSWGYNAFGQLGNGTTQNSGTPVQVTGLTNIRAIAASYYNGYAITTTDEAYAWGSGDTGAIGDGSAGWRLTPVLIPGLTNVRKIVAGEAGWAMALLRDGTAKAWGYNINGVLGTGAPNGVYRFTPEPVLGVTMANNLGAGTATAHVMSYMSNVTGVEIEPSEPAPLQLALRVAPVPSRSNTSLAFDLPRSGRVSIAVYDVAGRLVRSIVSETRPAGRHMTTWDGRTRAGVDAPAGVYFARLEREGEILTRRIVLVR